MTNHREQFVCKIKYITH